MADLSLKLTAFEGPLDLLLHLIERDKVDIYDIPIAAVTEQYISYLRSMSEFDMEVASDFLVMAATLLQIKSRMLLPKQSVEGEEEEADPRQQLVEMLVEYRRIKRAAAALADMKQSADLYWQREPMFGNLVERTVAPCTVQQLLKALAGMTTAPDGKQAAFIEPQAYSVQDKMADILQKLQRQPQGFMLNEILPQAALPRRWPAFGCTGAAEAGVDYYQPGTALCADLYLRQAGTGGSKRCILIK